MKQGTKVIIETALAGDATVTREQAQMALEMLSGNVAPEQAQAALETLLGVMPVRKVNPVERPFTRRETAEMLNCCTRTVDHYANSGVLVRVKAAGGRLRGFTAASVRALAEGR